MKSQLWNFETSCRVYTLLKANQFHLPWSVKRNNNEKEKNETRIQKIIRKKTVTAWEYCRNNLFKSKKQQKSVQNRIFNITCHSAFENVKGIFGNCINY